MQPESAIVHSSASDEWETPKALYDALDKEFDFQLDPCCTVTTQKCDVGFGLEPFAEEGTLGYHAIDGLLYHWSIMGYKRVFVNPPYSQIGTWVWKCHREAQEGCTSVMLIPGRTGTTWWHKYMPDAYEIREIAGRVYFKGMIKQKDGTRAYGQAPAPFDSVVVVFKPKPADQPVRRVFWKVARR